jgi:hypothetical protein
MNNVTEVVKAIENGIAPELILENASDEAYTHMVLLKNLANFEARQEALTRRYLREQATILGKQF